MNKPPQTSPDTASNAAAPRAGLLLILTAILTIVAVVGRVAADADQPTLIQSLAAISENPFAYGIGGLARLASGLTLVVGAFLLLRTWIIRQRYGTPLAPWLFIISGIFTAVSGACALALVASAPTSVALGSADSIAETTASLRWIAGKAGFTMAGLALIVAARYQWMAGATLRRIAPISALLGIAMQLIWAPALSIVHQAAGALFVLWLLVIGIMLLTGRVERHFATMVASSSSDEEETSA